MVGKAPAAPPAPRDSLKYRLATAGMEVAGNRENPATPIPKNRETTMNETKLQAINDKNANPHELAHALTTAQKLIHRLNPTTTVIQISGRLRHLELHNHLQIKLIAIPKPKHNLVGELLPHTHSALHGLLHEQKDFDWYVPDPPQYQWKANHYRWTLITVDNIHEFAVTQLLMTGPDSFVDWITNEESRGGALPWAWAFHQGRLYNNNFKLIKTPTERHIFNQIGYEFIPLQERSDGNPNYWKQNYKKPEKAH